MNFLFIKVIRYYLASGLSVNVSIRFSTCVSSLVFHWHFTWLSSLRIPCVSDSKSPVEYYV